METGNWIEGANKTQQWVGKCKKQKRKQPDNAPGASRDGQESGDIHTKHTHTKDCCQYGRLVHLTKCDQAPVRLSDTHLAKLTKQAGYRIQFIPKYHCGSCVTSHV